MALLDILIYGLISGFSTAFGLAFNEWLFKKRIEKALIKFEKALNKQLNGKPLNKTSKRNNKHGKK